MKDSTLRLALILWIVVALMNAITFTINLVRGEDALLILLQALTAVASLATLALLIRAYRKKEE